MMVNNTDSLLLTVDQVRQKLNVGRSKAWSLIWENQIPSIKIGRSVRIPAKALEDWVEDQQKKADN